MKTKMKLWWSLGAIALILVVAGTSIGVTIAALQARVNSSFSISYTAKNVNAVIVGYYSYGACFTYEDTEELDLYDGVYNGRASVKDTFFVANGETFVNLAETSQAQFDPMTLEFNSSIYNDPRMIEGAKKDIANVSNVGNSVPFDQTKITSWGNLFVDFHFIFINFSEHELPVRIEVQNLQTGDNVTPTFSLSDGQEFEDSAEFTVDAAETETSMQEFLETARQAIQSGLLSDMGINDMDDAKNLLKQIWQFDELSDDEACAILGLSSLPYKQLTGSFELINNSKSCNFSGSLNFTLGQ